MSEIERMSLSEHWLAYGRAEQGMGGMVHVLRSESDVERYRQSQWAVEGPFVLAIAQGGVSRMAELEAERQAVLDAVNLYGDETLHKALDAIGWPTTTGEER